MTALLNSFMSFPAGSGPAPSGTTLNFLTGSYVVNDVIVTAADIVDQPELITVDGLVMTDPVVNTIGDLLALFLTANWTIVLKWDHLDYTGNILPLVITDADTNDNAVQIKRQDGLGSHFMNVQDFTGAHFRGTTDSSAAIGDNAHTIALTRTNSKLAFSVDGRSVVTYSGSPDTFSIVPTAACFGGYPGNSVNSETRIKSLRVYAPMDDSLLPALSA